MPEMSVIALPWCVDFLHNNIPMRTVAREGLMYAMNSLMMSLAKWIGYSIASSAVAAALPAAAAAVDAHGQMFDHKWCTRIYIYIYIVIYIYSYNTIFNYHI